MADWLPTRSTAVDEADAAYDFCLGDRVIALAEHVYSTPENPNFVLDDWQKWLIRQMLVTDLEGNLRYRQIVVSMGRQNGKSVLGAILTLFGLLMHVDGPEIVGLASNANQAGIIYKRLLYLILNNRSLSKRFKKATETRGIILADNSGWYRVFASKGSSLQGLTSSLAIIDELHIVSPDVYNALLIGTGQRRNGLVVGITTAGDDTSTLLKDLYTRGTMAIDGDPDFDSFGFFLWEAPIGCDIDDVEAIKSANPAIASGRMSLKTALEEIASLPEVDARRYRLNQFVGSSNAWISSSIWAGCATDTIPSGSRLTFCVDRSPEHDYASISAAAVVDGQIYTEIVCSLVKPSQEQLLQICIQLFKHSPSLFVMDSYSLSNLGSSLKAMGYPVAMASQKDSINASTFAYSQIMQGKVTHAHDALLAVQMPLAIRKNVGESWRLSRRDSTVAIDGVMSTILGMYFASMMKPDNMQIY